MKIGDTAEIADEINVLCTLNQNITKNENETNSFSLTPKIFGYGFLALQNYKKVSKKETDEENYPSFGYFLMTPYQTSLQ